MKTFTSWNTIPKEDRGAVAAIGNFDGVHLGHLAVIDLARAKAIETGAPLGILTFEPHPREFFAPDAPPFRLMNPEAKANRMAKVGVDYLYQLSFDKTLSSLTAEQFAHKVIVDGLGLSHVLVGADFCFGKGRTGTADDLIRFGQAMGFDVTVAQLVQADSQNISSTAIRNALSEGRPADAKDMLGHWHRIEGPVIHGEKRGRELGYPTANMAITGLHPPKFGVYAVHVDVLSGPHKGSYQGAASIGVRPMFGENIPNCESHLFDFDGDLYGTHLSVALIEYLRPELKFDGLDALITQMGADCETARQLLSAL